MLDKEVRRGAVVQEQVPLHLFSQHKTLPIHTTRSRIAAFALVVSVAALLAALAFGTRPATAAQSYTVEDLGTLGGQYSEAISVNDSGQVVGRSQTVGGTLNQQHAFLWEDGQMRDLGTITGGDGFSSAEGINDSGQVAGTSSGSCGSTGFLWEDGQMQALGTSACGGMVSASGINDSGQVTGTTNNADGVVRAALWEDGQTRDLGVLGAFGGYSESRAFDINTSGQVIGETTTASHDDYSAFLWEDGQMRDLGTLGGDALSTALGINDSGQVVGASAPSDGSSLRAFLWEDGQMQDLNDLIPADSGWNLAIASDINASDQIVGRGIVNGEEHAFLLTPDTSPADVTDPVADVTTPDDGAAYALGQQVTAEYSCEDEPGGSGIASCEGTVPDGSAIDTTTSGAHTFVVEATDNAGNRSTATHSYTVSECTITGTEADDTLVGTPGADVICGLGGNDTVRGLGGNDSLRGEDGNDTLNGGGGNDSLDGGANTDKATYANPVVASLASGSATGEGSDSFADLEGLVGSKYDDTITGSAANNTLNGGAGNDAIGGEGGNDVLGGGLGDDSLDGGLGTDKANYAASLTAVIASLATNSATGEGADTFSGMENLQGSKYDDALTGAAATNVLGGGAGNDRVTGGAGADTLKGEDGADAVDSRDGVNGNDRLDGGAGTDTKTTDATEKSVVGFP